MISHQLRKTLRRLSRALIFYRTRPLLSSSPVHIEHVLERVRTSKVVVFGEQHQQPQILKAQLCILAQMVDLSENETQTSEKNQGISRGRVTLIMEMFNFEQQKLLDDFLSDKIDISELLHCYKGTEGFDLENHYGHLLTVAKELGVRVVGGFVPSDICNKYVRSGKESAFNEIQRRLGLDPQFYVEGTEEHYRYFQGLLTGSMENINQKYRRIFPVQILRDSSLAYKIDNEVKKSKDPNSRVLAICGSGHVDYMFGVPERIPSDIPVLVLTSRSENDSLEEGVADFVYRYRETSFENRREFEHP